MNTQCLVRNNVKRSGNQLTERTIVFVHGLGTDQNSWQKVEQGFNADFNVVLLDNVGAIASNRSDFLSHQVKYLNIQGYVDDLLEICSALNLSNSVTLVGHSLGAMVCLIATVRKPELFDKLVLIGASPCYKNLGDYHGGMNHEDIDSIYDALNNDYSAWAKNFSDMAMENLDRPQLATAFLNSLLSIPQEMMLTVLCSILQGVHRADVSLVSTPTLLIQSEHDFFVPLSVAEYLHSTIKNSRLNVIQSSGHLPQVSAPAKVIEAMLQFIN